MTTNRLPNTTSFTAALRLKSGWRGTACSTMLWRRSSLLASTCLLLAAAPVSLAQQSGDEEIAAPAPAAPAEPAAAAAAPASAGSAEAEVPTRTLERVRVTGSSIARTNAETAVPVTVIEAEEFKQQGITSAEGLVAELTTNDNGYGPAPGASGTITGGASYSNLRGIGRDKTLVLLNGRRLANNSLDGSAVDINTIPFGAIRRVEVLRDGASAIYGTDAIGGVINFITYENRQGGEIEFGYETPTRAGDGDSHDINATWGNGDLDTDGFNVMGSLSYRQQDALAASDRNDIRKVYDPDQGIFAVTTSTYPANYIQPGVSGNPLADSGCNAPGLVDLDASVCGYDYGRDHDIFYASEKTSLYTNASLALAEHHTASLSWLWSRNNTTFFLFPSPTGNTLLSPTSPGGRAFYPSDPALDATQPVRVNWLGAPAGRRKIGNTVDASRLMLEFEGDFADIDYQSVVGWNRSDTDIALRSGYLDDETLEEAFNSGAINPFSTEPLSEAGQQALADASVSGPVQEARNDIYFWDGQLSRTIGDWFGAGSSALALGADYRHEKLTLETDEEIASRASSGGFPPNAGIDQNRTVTAVYSELNVPIIDSLELTGAIRHDDYDDVGTTTNPKISFRYQPIQPLLFRGAYSEGFRAPTLYEIYAPGQVSFGPRGLNDPVLCPDGNVAPGGVENRDCNAQFRTQRGGNENLAPEEAKNWTFGIVFQPLSSFSAGLDFWWIEVENEVGTPSAQYVIDNDPDSIVRNDDGSIAYIPQLATNLGSTKTNGVDVSANYRMATGSGIYTLDLTGSWVDRFDYQDTPGSEYQSALGRYSGGTIFRWRHRMTLDWSNGPWAASLVNHFQTGYDDADPETHEEVSSWTTWDALGAYTFMDGPTLTLGAKNLFDRDPPFSNQPGLPGVAGYDPRYFSAVGRTLYARFNYTF